MVQMAWDYGPIPIIEDAREKSDWFKAIVFSAIQLERHGYLTIKEYLESKDVNAKLIEKLLERKHLYEIAEYLLTIRKISNKELRTIKAINEERNKFIHRREVKHFAHGEQAKIKYKPLVNEAMRILKEKFNVVRLHVSKG